MKAAAKTPEEIKAAEAYELGTYRSLILEDLFFIVQFVISVPAYDGQGRPFCNSPFVVDRCYEVQTGPEGGTLDLWARGHFKSVLLTQARCVQRILKYPDKCSMIVSATRPLAKKHFRSVMLLLEQSDMLKKVFPDILYQNPRNESPKWALDINTPVLTTNGWKKHGDLEIGDHIFGSDGRVITVIGNSGSMEGQKCRRVVFDDSEFVASSDHLWPVNCKRYTCSSWENESDLGKYLATTDCLPIKDKTKRLPPTPIIHPLKALINWPPLDPYILGLWLGDGTAGTNIISMHNDDEEEVLAHIKEAGFEYYIHRKKTEDNFSMYGVDGLKTILSDIGCLNEKYIPENYLLGTAEDRLSLLQGLMDSDGTCKKDGTNRCKGMCMFSNTNKKLADGVFFLAASLGLRPSMLSFMPKQRARQEIHQVYFVGLNHTKPFRLSRKLKNCNDKRHKVGRYVRKVEPIESVPVNCIKVDAPDGIYLAGKSLVPTHNSEDDGIIVKRKNNARKEATLEAWGIKEGMPIGVHFDWIILDDLETKDDVTNPEVVQKVRSSFDLTKDLLTVDGKISIVGTPYSHNGIYIPFVRDKVRANGEPAYIFRRYPATVDGLPNGKAIFLPQETLDDIRAEKGDYEYFCQQMIDPTPVGVRKLDGSKVIDVDPRKIPHTLLKFMAIDPAGDDKDGTGDDWAFAVIGIDPHLDDIGASDIYILDLIATPMREEEAPEEIARMYMRNGFILQVGVEKVGISTAEIHVANTLKKYGRFISQDNRSLAILRPAGRQKTRRIETALAFPTYNSKIHISTDVPAVYRDKLRTQMDEFPFGRHDDILDVLAYFYEMIRDYHFHLYMQDEEDEPVVVGNVIQMRNMVTGY